MRAPSPATHVYVLGFSDDVIKVGRTANVEKRFRQHASAAKVRDAKIVSRWTLETEHANLVEWHLRNLGRAHLRRLTGSEYFKGDFATFMAIVTEQFRRWGLMPAPAMTIWEAQAVYGKRAIARAFDYGEIRSWRNLITGEARVMQEDLDAWWAAEQADLAEQRT